MNKKITITFLVAVLTMMFSFAFATEDIGMYETMLLDAEPGLLISPAPDKIISPAPNRNAIRVQLDGEYVDFTDEQGNVVNPEILQERTMVPMRKIFEIFEAEVIWNGETRTVIATTAEKEITLTIDNTIAKVKDLSTGEEKEISLDAAPTLLNDRTMVPVRFIAESLEKEVGWDADKRTVIIIDFEKIAKEFAENTPNLNKLFALGLEPVTSFKTESEIEGKIVYKDTEDKTNSETVKVAGDLAINMNEEKAVEMYINLEFDGNGSIAESLALAGYDKVKLGMVVADGHLYLMMSQDGEEIWTDLGSEIDLSVLSSVNTSFPTSYEDLVNTYKTLLGELNTESYGMIKMFLSMMELIFSEENLQITGSTGKETIKMNLDLLDFLGEIDGSLVELLSNGKMEMSVVEKIKNKKIDTTKIEIETYLEAPETKESFAIEFSIDMKYKSINKNFEIEVPNI